VPSRCTLLAVERSAPPIAACETKSMRPARRHLSNKSRPVSFCSRLTNNSMFKQTATLNANRICSVCAGKIRSWFRALIFLHFVTARPARANISHPQDRLWAPDSWRTPRAIVDQPMHAYSFAPLKTLDLETFPVAALILSILALILFLKIFKRITPLIIAGCKRIGANIVTAQSNDTFKISIAVGNEEKYISLVLMELPFAAQEYKFQARRFLSGLRINGFLRPVLQLTWPQLTITHKFAPLTYSMVKTISLSYMQAHHLRNILKKPHFVLFHISRQKGDSLILPLEGTAWFSDMSPELVHPSRPNLTPPPRVPSSQRSFTTLNKANVCSLKQYPSSSHNIILQSITHTYL
jgi:hypothetical protein